MKPLVTGLVSFAIGAATGAGVLASTGTSGTLDKKAVEQIVHDYIMANPEAIVESVQKWQEGGRSKNAEAAKEKIQELKSEIFSAEHDGVAGNPKGDITIVEFFDYNCPACKMMFKGLDELVKNDKNVRVVFKELPIFGPSSDQNSKVGIAVAALAPEKYFPFHEKMMGGEGRVSETDAIAYAVELGLDEAKIKAEMAKDYVQKKIEQNHALAEELGVSGTPAVIVGDELIPSAMDYDTLKTRVAEHRKK